MNFDLSDEQKMLAEHMRALLAKRSSYDRLRVLIDAGLEWDEDLWRELGELGFLGAALPEAYGGQGLTDLDLAAISEQLGRANTAIPLFSSLVLAANAILLAGDDDQKAEWLPKLASGETVATFAYAEGLAGWSPDAVRAEVTGTTLSGTKSPVADGGVAALAVVLARSQGAPCLALVRLEAAYRGQARTWLAAKAPAHELPAGPIPDAEEAGRGKAWQACLAQAGYAGIALPKDMGGCGGSVMDSVIFAEEEARYALPKGPYMGIGQGMALATIIQHGTAEQIERFVRPTLDGELIWCQLFSEPAAGSDLAAVRTRATQRGDGWVIEGQKVWSSWAHEAEWGLLLARSDPTLPKHKGLSFFLLDMKTPGIDIRPIRQISGASDFNEVFFNAVEISDAFRLGPVGAGWGCAMTLLSSERLNAGTEEPTRSVSEIIALARATPRDGGSALDSSATRLTLAMAYAQEQAERHFQARMRTLVSRGEDPGSLPAIKKLSFVLRLQRLSGFAMEMRELVGLAPGVADLLGRDVAEDYIWSVAMRIAGGADEVLKNQLAERVLGMPGEQRLDKTAPFNTLG